MTVDFAPGDWGFKLSSYKLRVVTRDYTLSRVMELVGLQSQQIFITHSSPGLTRTSDSIRGCVQPWEPYGVARVDLSGLLLGQRMVEATVPVTNGPRAPEGGEESASVGAMGRGEDSHFGF